MTKRQLLSARIVKFWLDLAMVLGIVAAAVFLLAWLLAPFVAAESGQGYSVNLQVAVGEYSGGPWHSVLPLEVGPNTRIPVAQPRLVDASGELRFKADHALMHFTVNSIWVLAVFVSLWIVFLLRRIFQTVVDGDPFSLANAGRLRAIGVIIMAAGVLVPVFQYLAASAVLRQVAVEGVPLAPPLTPLFTFEFDIVLLGLMILALSTVFTHGVQLEDDQSLTV